MKGKDVYGNNEWSSDLKLFNERIKRVKEGLDNNPINSAPENNLFNLME